MEGGECSNRRKKLSDEEIDAIASAIVEKSHGNCKFINITPDDVSEAVKFYKNFNSVVENSKKTVLNTIIIVIITGLIGLTTYGAVVKINKGG